jgi:hypothetical protein
MKTETYRILGGSIDIDFTDEEIRSILKNWGYTIEMGRDTVEVPYGFGHIVKEVDCEVAYKIDNKGNLLTHPAQYLKVFNIKINHLGSKFWNEISDDNSIKEKLKEAIINHNGK